MKADGVGAVLTLLSKFWFDWFKKELPDVKTHFVSMGLPQALKSRLSPADAKTLEHRSMVVQRLEILPLESICRGYITGQSNDLAIHSESLTCSRLSVVVLQEDKYCQW